MAEEKNFVLTFLKMSESFYSVFIGILKWRGQTYPISSILLQILGAIGILYFIVNDYKIIFQNDILNIILKTLLRFNVFLLVLWTYFGGLYQHSRTASIVDDLWKITRRFEQLGIRLPCLQLIFYQIAEFFLIAINIYFVTKVNLLKSHDPLWWLDWICAVWMRTSLIICFTSFTKYVHLILLQFREVNAICRRLENPAYSVSQQILVILNIREQHMAISNATRKILNFYQHYLFLYSTWSVLGIVYYVSVINMYLETQNDEFYIVWYSASTILMIIGLILFMINMCTVAATEGNYTRNMIYDMTSDKHNLGLRVEVYSFFEYLERQKIEFRLYGTIGLNNSSLLYAYVAAISYWRIMTKLN
ncbi:Gustatory receptor 36 [Cephus cinctus]|uniref:Gustatory receptor n=1 Tax=Cephus cinctus TaxID=211228 RepID=A0A3L9LUP2_CEPCN|nr:uncharacterized protein LOC107270397 [Cephus cinctus]RLZ02227.1 Gustatory receptor 36 [Cephus cinctus]